jgi:hypothetical protein
VLLTLLLVLLGMRVAVVRLLLGLVPPPVVSGWLDKGSSVRRHENGGQEDRQKKALRGETTGRIVIQEAGGPQGTNRHGQRLLSQAIFLWLWCVERERVSGAKSFTPARSRATNDACV